MTRPLRVFLCHSSNDKPAVRELYQKLRAESWIQPWLDEEELYPGQDWDMEIEKAVEASDAVLVCLSNNSINKRGYVQKELRFVLDIALEMPEETIFIIPLRLEECTPPRSLREWQYADYFPESQSKRAFQRLLVSLKRRADSLGLNIETPAPEQSQVESLSYATPKPAPKIITPPNKITLSNGMELLRVPAGKFIMGSKDDNQLAYGDEKPQHTVDLPYDYWMARFPLTNELYNAYARSKGIKHPVDGWEKKKDHPVVLVTWKDALEYCQWLNQIQTSEFRIQNLQFRLPTEAEWEKAARWKPSQSGRGQGEGESLEYPWGNTFDKNKCNSKEGGKRDTTSVGNYSPQGDSPYGCADMSGNVWEWTHSLFKPYPYKVDDGREDEKKSYARVLRGGSFDSNGGTARCAYRLSSDSLLSYSGFRVVASPVLS